MSIIRPRLNDYHGIPLNQDEIDFAIPFLGEDIPLYVDPFLLWKSPSMQDKSLHLLIKNSFNQLGNEYVSGDREKAIQKLIIASECNEVGLGTSAIKKGRRIGRNLAENILDLFLDIPQIREQGFTHFEEIQLLIDNISKDRVSDIACNFLKSFLIDYTIEQAEKYSIPLDKVDLENIYNPDNNSFERDDSLYLPINPESNQEILFVPKRWLRKYHFLNVHDYSKSYYEQDILREGDIPLERVKLLEFNRENYDLVQVYTSIKERHKRECSNDPLFTQIPIVSASKKFSAIEKLATGNKNKADVKYENNICQLLASLFYPHLDYAKDQSRTDSGVLIRDLIFYNNVSLPFLEDIYKKYSSLQLVFEIKNVKELKREHINQLNRYLGENFGNFGVLVTRNRPPRKIQKNLIDLWSGQRKCILVITDYELELMVNVYESKQRDPIEVLNSVYIKFQQSCPS